MQSTFHHNHHLCWGVCPSGRLMNQNPWWRNVHHMHRANWFPVQQHYYHSTTTLCPKSIVEAQKEWSLPIQCLDCMMNAATLLYTLLISLSDHPDCVGITLSWWMLTPRFGLPGSFLRNSFFQSVQCTAITSSTYSPISGEKVHLLNVSGIPKAKGYDFTPLVDLFISIFAARPYFHIRVYESLVWHDTT